MVILQSGIKAFYQTKGLKQTASISDKGQKKLIEVTLFNGTALKPDQNYRVLTNNFLTSGGDDFGTVINKGYTIRKFINHGKLRSQL